jgi:predicted alpha-1,2-mannosidase
MRRIVVLIGLVVAAKFAAAQTKTPANYINPFIGTSRHGNGRTIPGAITPFGMVQVNPNTITGGDNGMGYIYENEYIEGFAFTQMSGIGWYGDLGNLLTTPTTGPLQVVAGRHAELGKGYRSHYKKDDEIAKAGYYAATLTDYNVRAEATAAPHSGMLRFTFPENKQSRIQIDLARRCGGTSVLQYVKVVNKNTIEGWMKCTPEGGGWGDGTGKADYTVYFYASFSKPVKNFGVWSADIPEGINRKRESVMSLHYDSLIAKSAILSGCKEKEGKHLGFYTEFATTANEKVLMKSGISFSSLEGAKSNVEQEIPAWDFEKIVADAKVLWNKQLEKITVTGGTEDQKAAFYTASYHAMMDPRTITDLNGNYPGADHKVHKATDFTKISVFSGWDVFRSEFPLQTIINPKVVSNMITSLVTMAEQSGQDYLERWELLNAYSGCMVGNPAVAVIADAYNKGIRDFDISNAYKYSKQSVDKFGNGKNFKLGNYDISLTLEYAYDEWCVANLASSLGKTEDVATYTRLSKSYKNVFDPQVGWFRPRNQDGSWRPWPAEGRLKESYGSVESDPYQQGWFVPHDINGLVNLLGGREKTIADLNSFFEHTPKDLSWNAYYNHSNEPVHLVPFMFNRLGAPWLTQKWVRFVCENGYQNTISGIVGNEDVGQMSAWFVLAASGLHQACPGDTRYEIFGTIFNTVAIHAEATGKTFTINATNNSPQNMYIQSAKLNGKTYNKCYIDHTDILKGGILDLVMGPEPNKSWGVE